MLSLIALILIIIGGIIVSYIVAVVDIAKSKLPMPLKIGLLIYAIGAMILLIIFG